MNCGTVIRGYLSKTYWPTSLSGSCLIASVTAVVTKVVIIKNRGISRSNRWWSCPSIITHRTTKTACPRRTIINILCDICLVFLQQNRTGNIGIFCCRHRHRHRPHLDAVIGSANRYRLISRW